MDNAKVFSIRLRDLIMGIGSVGAVIALASCGKQSETPNSSQTEQSSKPAVSDNGGETVKAVDKIDYSRNDEFGLVLGEEIRVDEYGKYNQLTVSKTSPLLKFDKTVVEESVSYAFTEDEVRSAQGFIAPFVVEQADSTLLWDDSSEGKNEWLEENIDKFSEAVEEDLVEEIQNPKDDWYVVTNGNANGWKNDTAPIYVEGQARIAFTDLKLQSISAFIDEEENDERLRFDYEWTIAEDLYDSEETGVIITRSLRTFALKRDGNGGWLITGWMSKFVYEAVSAENYDPTKKYAQKSFDEVDD